MLLRRMVTTLGALTLALAGFILGAGVGYAARSHVSTLRHRRARMR